MKPVVKRLPRRRPRQLLDLQPAGQVSRCERCHEGAARVLGSITVDRLTEEELLTKTCSIDWPEAQHDIAIVDDLWGARSRPVSLPWSDRGVWSWADPYPDTHPAFRDCRRTGQAVGSGGAAIVWSPRRSPEECCPTCPI